MGRKPKKIDGRTKEGRARKLLSLEDHIPKRKYTRRTKESPIKVKRLTRVQKLEIEISSLKGQLEDAKFDQAKLYHLENFKRNQSVYDNERIESLRFLVSSKGLENYSQLEVVKFMLRMYDKANETFAVDINMHMVGENQKNGN